MFSKLSTAMAAGNNTALDLYKGYVQTTDYLKGLARQWGGYLAGVFSSKRELTVETKPKHIMEQHQPSFYESMVNYFWPRIRINLPAVKLSNEKTEELDALSALHGSHEAMLLSTTVIDYLSHKAVGTGTIIRGVAYSHGEALQHQTELDIAMGNLTEMRDAKEWCIVINQGAHFYLAHVLKKEDQAGELLGYQVTLQDTLNCSLADKSQVLPKLKKDLEISLAKLYETEPYMQIGDQLVPSIPVSVDAVAVPDHYAQSNYVDCGVGAAMLGEALMKQRQEERSQVQASLDTPLTCDAQTKLVMALSAHEPTIQAEAMSVGASANAALLKQGRYMMCKTMLPQWVLANQNPSALGLSAEGSDTPVEDPSKSASSPSPG